MRLVESDLAVDELLRSLPPRMRVVLVLRYVDGLSDEVIADRLGIATGTVRSQAHRALAHVRAGLVPRGTVDGPVDGPVDAAVVATTGTTTTEVGRGHP